jgi:hypothetical protein
MVLRAASEEAQLSVLSVRGARGLLTNARTYGAGIPFAVAGG